MSLYFNLTNHKEFSLRIFNELRKLPFGSLPKAELELLILDALIRSIDPLETDPYSQIEKHFNLLKAELKLSQTQLKNKLLSVQLRYDVKSDKDVEVFILESIKNGNYLVENNLIVLSIFNPLLNDQAKSYFETKGIVSDTSFNKSILKISLNGFIQFLKSLDRISESKKDELELILNQAQKDGLIQITIQETKKSKIEKFESFTVIGDNIITFIEKLTPFIPSILSIF
ncbi:MAG: hypothetical protein KA521_09045 [Crocinitomicaceae bacterium]|nr:hypothetical protein [Crocinitomicaceae bacterium]